MRADIIYEKTRLTDRTIIPGTWSDPLYMNISSPASSSVADDDDDDDVPAYAYYIIGFGLGLLIAIIILIAVCVFCCNITDRLYDKKKCVSTSCLNHGILK